MSTPPDLAGTLTVTDREAAGRALAELIARLGGTEIARREDPRGLSVDLVIAASAYAELAEGLARIGRWQPGPRPPEVPAQVRVSVLLAAD